MADDWVAYYKQLYPFCIVFDWLTATNNLAGNLGSREFAFQFDSGAMKRFQNFLSTKDFKKAVTTQNPVEIHLGGIYVGMSHLNRIFNWCAFNTRTITQRVGQPLPESLSLILTLTTIQAENVVVIKKMICSPCWLYLVLAIHIIRQMMEERFGYSQLLWVYSGWRGVHLWVCDHDALLLDDKERQQVMYHLTAFQLLNGKEVLTWWPEGGRQEGKIQSKKEKLVGWMRHKIELVFK